MAGPYSRFGSGSEEYFRQLITGGDIDMQPEETPGIMSRSRFAGRSAPEAILTTPDQPEAPDMTFFENFAKWLGRSSDDPNRVADAVLRDSQPVRATGTLDEYDMLPPLESITGARQDQTREALGEVTQSEPDVSEDLFASRGGAWRDNQIVSYSYYNKPLEESGVRGVSRRHGDASHEVQRAAINAIIREGRDAGLSNEDIALTLAIARHESGFNPDAAAGSTSAHGLGQFVNRTGEAYGLTDQNRWDINAQARALVEHTKDNIRLSESRGQGREYVYAYHHDGPSLAYGGLDIGRQNVMPRVGAYLELVNQYREE